MIKSKEYTVTGLREGLEYNFRAFSVNTACQSETAAKVQDRFTVIIFHLGRDGNRTLWLAIKWLAILRKIKDNNLFGRLARQYLLEMLLRNHH